MLKKIKEIWNDYIVWYTIDKPKEIYGDIRHWFKTCAKYRSHWKFGVYSLFHCYPWDFSYFLESQYYWLNKSQEYFNDKCYCSEEKLYEINRYQRICIGLIEIILDKRKYWDYDFENKKSIMLVRYNLKNKHRFLYEGVDIKGNYHYPCTEIYEENPEEYYKYKAKYLYFKILREKADNWWD